MQEGISKQQCIILIALSSWIQGPPPLWANRVYLWNFCNQEWDEVYEHQFRVNQQDCSLYPNTCGWWGPIFETWYDTNEPEIDELGFENSFLYHDGIWSSLVTSETSFKTPDYPWVLFHLEPNSGFGAGNYYTPAIAPTTTTNAATAITATGATLNGTVNANYSDTTVTFDYGLTPSYGNSATAMQSPVTGGTSTGVSATITGLAGNTLYHYRVQGTNLAGTSYGGDVTFTTLPPTLPPTLPDPPSAVSAFTGNAQAAVAFVPPASDGGSPINFYTVTSNPGSVTASGTSTLITVPGLTNGVAYTFTVTATNGVGTSSPSNSSNSVIPTTDLVRRVEGGVTMGSYSALQTAYNESIDGDIIEMQTAGLSEDPDFSLGMGILLKGGYDASFTTQAGMTYIHGAMTIRVGTVTIENLLIY